MVNGTPTTNPISEKHTPSYNTSIIKNPSVHFETFAKIRKPYKPKKPSTKKNFQKTEKTTPTKKTRKHQTIQKNRQRNPHQKKDNLTPKI